MKNNYLRGKSFELDVAAMVRKKADQAAKRNKGSHANWHRRSDIFTNLPIHIEAKDHETIKVKEWYRQAEGAAAAFETPVVVFRADEKILCMLSFDELLNLYIELTDLKLQVTEPSGYTGAMVGIPIDPENDTISKEGMVFQSDKFIQFRGSACKNGHVADEYGKCLTKGCPHSRGFKRKKEKK